MDYKIIDDPNCCSYPAMYDISLTPLRIISLSQIQNEIDGKGQDMLSCRCFAIVPSTDPPVLQPKSMPSLVLLFLSSPYPSLVKSSLAFVLELSPLAPMLSLPQLLALQSPMIIHFRIHI